MRILLGGSSGLIGSALVPALEAAGHTVVRLVRRPGDVGPDRVFWDPAADRLDPADVAGCDAAVNLAGENLGQGRWSAAKKARILDSRVDSTHLLAATLARLEPRPRTFISASAVGFYGDRGDEELDERSASGGGFLAGVCRQWELAASPAAEAGIRSVRLRMGVVFSPQGGALAAMLPLFRTGLGGRLGSGRQYVSWIAPGDLVRAVAFVLEHESLQGPVNAVSPHPVTNRELAAALGQALHRPSVAAVPAFSLRLALGEMADEMLLASARVVPRRLLDAGFTFDEPDLAALLRKIVTS